MKISREWESNPNLAGMAIGFGINETFKVNEEDDWYVSYQPTCPDSGTEETALMHYAFGVKDTILRGDHRNEVSARFREGGKEAVEDYFATQCSLENGVVE